jgi:hypothetical protein
LALITALIVFTFCAAILLTYSRVATAQAVNQTERTLDAGDYQTAARTALYLTCGPESLAGFEGSRQNAAMATGLSDSRLASLSKPDRERIIELLLACALYYADDGDVRLAYGIADYAIAYADKTSEVTLANEACLVAARIVLEGKDNGLRKKVPEILKRFKHPDASQEARGEVIKSLYNYVQSDGTWRTSLEDAYRHLKLKDPRSVDFLLFAADLCNIKTRSYRAVAALEPNRRAALERVFSDANDSLTRFPVSEVLSRNQDRIGMHGVATLTTWYHDRELTTNSIYEGLINASLKYFQAHRASRIINTQILRRGDQLFRQKNDIRQAEQCATALVDLQKNLPSKNLADDYSMLALDQVQQGKLAEARGNYEKSIEVRRRLTLEPLLRKQKYIEARQSIAETYFVGKDMKKAKQISAELRTLVDEYLEARRQQAYDKKPQIQKPIRESAGFLYALALRAEMNNARYDGDENRIQFWLRKLKSESESGRCINPHYDFDLHSLQELDGKLNAKL